VRLLYVTSSFPYGPGEAFLVAELAELEAQGHEVVVVPTYPRGNVVHDDARALLDRARAVPLLSPRIAASAARVCLADLASSARAVRPVARSRSATVLAKNAAVVPKSLWTTELARSLAVDHIHAHWAGTSATVAMVAAEITRIPWSLTVHRWDIGENNLLRQKVDSAAFVRAISASGLADLRRSIGDTTTPTPVIHMGVPLPTRPEPPTPRSSDEPLRILVPANLLEVKGHRHLVDAVSLLRAAGEPVIVALAGEGRLRPALERQVADLGLERAVVFLGQLSHAALLEQLAAGNWDAVVMPSIETAGGEREGIPVSLLEAMSYRVPVVGTRAGGVVELLRDGSGMLVPPANAAALADAIATLARDDSLRIRLGAAGRDRVERDFAARSVVRELAAHFEAAGPASDDR
jgi:glycosyltransferase involved in cell wall biosynthesis